MASDKIKSFTGEYDYLSNFYPSQVDYEGISYSTAEHAFQAAKTHDAEQRLKTRDLATPGKAKRFGRKVTLRDDWQEVKVAIMEEVCYIKFSQNPLLASKLLSTGDAYLEEGNNHGDRFWGTVRGTGENQLGNVLMCVRQRLKGGK